jgi:hypothetical protein
MQVDAKAARVINEKGNQQLDIAGVVIPFGHSGVLPEGPGISYNAKIEHVASSGGFVSFALSIEAVPPASAAEPVTPEPEVLAPAMVAPEPQKLAEIDLSKPAAPKNLRVASN